MINDGQRPETFNSLSGDDHSTSFHFCRWCSRFSLRRSRGKIEARDPCFVEPESISAGTAACATYLKCAYVYDSKVPFSFPEKDLKTPSRSGSLNLEEKRKITIVATLAHIGAKNNV